MITKKHYSPVPRELAVEKKTGKSKTVQNMSFSVNDLYKKYAGGLNPAITRLGVFEETPDIDNPNPMMTTVDPLTTMDEMKRSFKNLNDKLSHQLSQKKAADIAAKEQSDSAKP